jgi:hypothetical protein
VQTRPSGPFPPARNRLCNPSSPNRRRWLGSGSAAARPQKRGRSGGSCPAKFRTVCAFPFLPSHHLALSPSACLLGMTRYETAYLDSSAYVARPHRVTAYDTTYGAHWKAHLDGIYTERERRTFHSICVSRHSPRGRVVTRICRLGGVYLLIVCGAALGTLVDGYA